ncbi:MAG: hypothetical protein ABEK17_01975 [Candidatus Aenigmatarchaeota archaeon]
MGRNGDIPPSPGNGKIKYEGNRYIHPEPACEYDDLSEESSPNLNKNGEEGLFGEIRIQRATRDEIYFYGKYER